METWALPRTRGSSRRVFSGCALNFASSDRDVETLEALKAYLYKGRSRIAPDRLDSLSQGTVSDAHCSPGCSGKDRDEKSSEYSHQTSDL